MQRNPRGHYVCYNNRQAQFFVSLLSAAFAMSDTSNETHSTMPLQAEQQKTQVAEATQSFLQSILDTGREPFLVLDANLNVVTANRAFYQTFATDEATTVGRFVYDLGDGQWDISGLRRLLEEVLPQESVFEGFEVTHDFPGVGTKTMRLNGRKLYRPGNHTTMFLLALEDVSGERSAETARREAEERLTLLVEGAHDYAMILLDPAGRIQSWNTGAQRILGYEEDDVLGQSIDLIFTPEDRTQGRPGEELTRAATDGKAMDIRWHLRKDGTRFWADGVLEGLFYEDGRLRGFSKILRDATERRQAEEALREAGDRASEILESIGDAFFALDLNWHFTYVNAQAEQLLARRRDDLTGKTVWAEFPEAIGSQFEQQYRRAMLEGVTVSFEEYFAPLSSWFEVRAYPSSVGLSVYFHNVTAQHEAAERLAAAYDAERRRAEREALLNQIGAAIRASEDPAEIQQVAVNALAEALGADRCYFAQFHSAQDVSEITTEYHRPSLPPAAQRYSLSDVPSLADGLYAGSQAYVVSDTQEAGFDRVTTEFLTRLCVRSFVRLPMRERAGQSVALVVAMADVPRDWTPDEIALVEAVATLMRTAMADARVRLREHRIATQLQDALQPPLPAAVPGLALGKYYEAALDEAGVGGDFYDVFPISPTCTALVVGDLSGKGLAAAAQVSTVRNMLRATLYLGQSVAVAVINLNNILADNVLLTGFATLFVGVYDASSGLLRYVNCGQEPGLVRRAATGQVEMLDPTGPVLGAFPDADYTQEQTLLCPGDALALFTDGLTEAGPSRADMLELEGIAALLGAEFAPAEDFAAQAESLTLSLIDSVDRFAESGVRDDVCLLVAVATN